MTGMTGLGATDLEVTDNQDHGRYEGRVGDVVVSVADYRIEGGRAVLPHTETDPAYQGRGIAGEVVRYALDNLRAKGLRVVPACPFVARWIEDHPAYADLLA